MDFDFIVLILEVFVGDIDKFYFVDYEVGEGEGDVVVDIFWLFWSFLLKVVKKIFVDDVR